MFCAIYVISITIIKLDKIINRIREIYCKIEFCVIDLHKKTKLEN